MKTKLFPFILVLPALLFISCYSLKRSSGGGQRVDFTGERVINAADIALPEGYTIEMVASGLTFPTGICFDDSGAPFVVESGYAYGETFTQPTLKKIQPDGSIQIVATGTKNGPWNGVYYHDGSFYIAEGGQIEGGKIIRINADGETTTLLDGLPSLGDHHTNGPVIKDGYIYFGQGTATNSGIVGRDNYEFGWLKRNTRFHDIPCQDITLSGINYETPDFFSEKASVSTGAFMPFGTATDSGQVVKGQIPCSGAVMRIPLEGGEPVLVAWGFRNPYGLAFDNNSNLFITDNGYDDRGSRPVWGTGDFLFKVEQDAWYGWPDYSGHHQVSSKHFKVPGEGIPEQILAKHPSKPPHPAAYFGVHSSSNSFDFSRSENFGFKGEAFVAQFGDMAPGVGKVLSPVGFKVVRADPETGVVLDFAVNRKGNAPAVKLESGGLERPVAVRFSPDGSAMYIVDFGIMLTTDEGPRAYEETGVIWKVTREDIP
jgi:hypothetical protein